MPYLKQDFRDEIEHHCDLPTLRQYFVSLEEGNFLGALNYLVYSIVRAYIEKHGKKYARLAGIVGTIHCCANEIYRRIAGPYEDEKIKENGDV